MNSQENREDLPFILFLVPFALSGVYAIYLWVQGGISATLPQAVFLQVTQNPYVFLVGFVAVIFGSIMDVLIVEPSQRKAKLIQESGTLQKIAVIALVLGALSAWYSAGFDPGQAASNIIAGRYVIVFPALLVVFSFLMLPAINFRKDQTNSILVVILLLAVPVSIDEVGKRSFFVGMALGLVLLAAATYLYLKNQGGSKRSA